jgi:periplasmic protein TonB
VARESFLSWSIALGLSALIHLGVAGALSGQSWTARDFALPVVLPVELIETQPIAREEPRPIPPPARNVTKETPPAPPKVLKETPPLPPVETKPMPVPEPPAPEVIKRADPVMDTPPAPAPPANAPPAPSPAPSPPMSALLPAKERETSRGVGPALGEVRKSPIGDAPPPGSSSAPPSVASLPRPGIGSSGSTSGTGPPSGTSTRGITQWAHPQGGYQVHPSYPASARRLGIQGTARLKVQVLADGRVGEIIVESSAGHADLDRAATDAVRQWHFEPARRGSEPVSTWVLLPVQFQLK